MILVKTVGWTVKVIIMMKYNIFGSFAKAVKPKF